ncbi:MAG: tRNA 2-thiouridine(34) synthase MnmA [Desulfobacterales bacterium]|nr:tRNA 2-thiouridine(34) synthase MnmA [Desulfobacterales bacterium]
MKQITAIALSGGIDSLTAAYLLKQQGHHVIGIHFITGFETEDSQHPNSGYSKESSEDGFSASLNSHTLKINNIAKQLGIEINFLDIKTDFKLRIVDYFTRTYLSGKTPNPCLVCNPSIKFGVLLTSALELGASHLATGHYANISEDRMGRFHLLRGIDREKDQSYFLSFLTQTQLSHACFPLGKMTKADVKKLAKEQGLFPVIKKESQDICFIKDDRYQDFISQQPEFNTKPGNIVDMEGNILGRHNGLHLFTIGQRRGINCPAAQPYYVVRIDITQNLLIVGLKKDLLSSKCKVSKINWIAEKPSSPLDLYTRVRYRHKAVKSKLIPDGDTSATIIFNTPQSAVTPGQGAVFYMDDEVIGGGWIDA